MLGVGFWELVVILVVAAIVLGPERMVSVAKKAGALFAQLQRSLDQARAGFLSADEEDKDKDAQ